MWTKNKTSYSVFVNDFSSFFKSEHRDLLVCWKKCNIQSKRVCFIVCFFNKENRSVTEQTRNISHQFIFNEVNCCWSMIFKGLQFTEHRQFFSLLWLFVTFPLLFLFDWVYACYFCWGLSLCWQLDSLYWVLRCNFSLCRFFQHVAWLWLWLWS